MEPRQVVASKQGACFSTTAPAVALLGLCSLACFANLIGSTLSTIQEVKVKVVTAGDHAYVRMLDSENGAHM